MRRGLGTVLLLASAIGVLGLGPPIASAQDTPGDPPSITLEPDSGQPGWAFRVVGSDFVHREQECFVGIYWEPPDVERIILADVTLTGDVFTFDVTVEVPDDAQPGLQYSVVAEPTCGIPAARAPFSVNPPPPEIMLSPDQGRPPGSFRVTGQHWQYREDCTVNLSWGWEEEPLGSALVQPDLTFTADVPIPADAEQGSYQVRAFSCFQDDAIEYFYVPPPPASMTLSPSSGPGGTLFMAHGTGWADADTSTCVVEIRWLDGDTNPRLDDGDVFLDWEQIGEDEWEVGFRAPDLEAPAGAPDTYTVRAESCLGQQADARFTIPAPPTTTSSTTSTTTTTSSTTTSTTTTSTSSTTTSTTTTSTSQPPTTVTPPPTPPPTQAANQQPRTQPTTTTTSTTTTTVPAPVTGTTTTSTTTSSTTTTTTPAQSETTTTTELVESLSPAGGPMAFASLSLDPAAPPPGGGTTATGEGCDANASVIVTVGELPPVHTQSDADGRFQVRLPLPELEPGRYEVVALCGPQLTATVDVMLLSAQGGAASSSAVLVFFVLVGVGLWQLRRGIDPTGLA